MSRFPVLRHVGFRHFLLSRMFSGAAIQVQTVAVGWQIYDISRNSLDLGLAGLAVFLPYIPLVLTAGSVADRHSRSAIMLLCAAAQAGCALIFCAFALSGMSVTWPMFLVLVIFGATRAFIGPAQLALIPNLVPQNELGPAVALNSVAVRLAVIAGPMIGGALYAISGVLAYSMSFAFFVLAGLSVLKIPPVPRQGAPVSGGWQEALAGFVHIGRERLLLGLISLDLFAVVLGGATALLPVYARDILHVGPVGLGVLHGAAAIGSISTAILLSAHPLRRSVGKIMLVSVAVFGAAIAVFGFSTNPILSFAALVVSGGADMVSVYVRHTLLQVWTPDSLRGRVNAVNGVFLGASNEIGAFRAGTFAAMLGAVPTVVIGGLGTVAVALLWVRLFPGLLRVETMEPKQPKMAS
ncbi:MFS transporter [Pseudochelatococcus sp. B33]